MNLYNNFITNIAKLWNILTEKCPDWELSDPAKQVTEICPALQISLTKKCPDWELSVFDKNNTIKIAFFWVGDQND